MDANTSDTNFIWKLLMITKSRGSIEETFAML
jgi:hypothetical protein